MIIYVLLYLRCRICRDEQFYSHSFGDGVSETESEEDEEDNASTPTPSAKHGTGGVSRAARRRINSGDSSVQGDVGVIRERETLLREAAANIQDKFSLKKDLGSSITSGVLPGYRESVGFPDNCTDTENDRWNNSEAVREVPRTEKGINSTSTGVTRTLSQLSNFGRGVCSNRNSQVS